MGDVPQSPGLPHPVRPLPELLLSGVLSRSFFDRQGVNVPSQPGLNDLTNDVDALYAWIQERARSPRTRSVYRIEVERFLLWCAYKAGRPIGDLLSKDLTDYRDFLCGLNHGDADWCLTAPAAPPRGSKQRAPTRLQTPRRSDGAWRPFSGPLSVGDKGGIATALRTLRAFLNWLSAGNYLLSNPLTKAIGPTCVERHRELGSTHSYERVLTPEVLARISHQGG